MKNTVQLGYLLLLMLSFFNAIFGSQQPTLSRLLWALFYSTLVIAFVLKPPADDGYVGAARIVYAFALLMMAGSWIGRSPTPITSMWSAITFVVAADNWLLWSKCRTESDQ